MLLSKLLNLPTRHFTLRSADCDQDVLAVHLESRPKRCRCPLCHHYSYSIHSRYRRSVQDLPCFAHKTLLHLTLHKFYCRNPRCPRKIFTERLDNCLAPHQRRTQRLSELLLSFVRQMSARGAERLGHLLHFDLSDTTMGRLLQKQPLSELATPKVLGVDEGALKKRNRYGTILVDLERHKIVDLLADREPRTLQQWLEEHPGVQVVSRDRYTNYAGAVSAVLPECTQVVDRWHLLKNLCEDLRKLVERNHQHLKYTRKKEIQRLQAQRRSLWRHQQEKESSERTVNYTRRWVQLRQIKRLKKKGVPIRQMAHLLGMSRRYGEKIPAPAGTALSQNTTTGKHYFV